MTHSAKTSTRARVYLSLYLIIAFVFLLRLFGVITAQWLAPFDLIFESPNLSTIQLIRAGENPYNPEIYSQLPFVITLYTPLYHYLTACLPILEENPFFFGRLVSVLAMFGSAFALFFVNPRNRIRLLPVIALGVFFSFWPVIKNTALLKNDSLALLFSVYAVVVVHRRTNHKGLLWAALLCVCALSTKQSYLSASIACLVYLGFVQRQQCLIFLGYLLLFSLAFVLLSSWWWGSGFWFSTVTALSQKILSGQAILLVSHMLQQPLFWLLIGLTLASLVVELTQKPLKHLAGESPYFIYLLVSLGLAAATLGKLGASTNYFLEGLLAMLMWLVYFARNVDYSYFSRPVFFIVTGAFVTASLLELQLAEISKYSFVNQDSIPTVKAYYRQMNRRIDALGFEDPRILNLTSHMHGYSISDTLYLNDPFHYRMLWEDGVLDVAPLVRAIKTGYFDIIMSSSPVRPGEDRFHPQIIKAVGKHYRIAIHGGGYFFYVRSC